jgi:hypothetical protein
MHAYQAFVRNEAVGVHSTETDRPVEEKSNEQENHCDSKCDVNDFASPRPKNVIGG